MRLLFVNHLHPDTGLVGAVRMQRFAEELVAQGHRVLLLCACHAGTPDTQESFVQRFSTHDWARPFLLAVRDDSPILRRTTARGTSRVLQRAATAAGLLIHGGPFWRWQHAVRPFRESIRGMFSPELAYATFGNLDALAIARDYARSSGIPWVMDIKDPASHFIPKPLAGLLMRRYTDASAVTLNSEFQRSHNGCWANDASTLIYSGIETRISPVADYDPTRVAMIGSIYSDNSAEVLLRGFAAWRQHSRPDAMLYYFGVDSQRFTAAAKRAGIMDGVVLEGQVPRSDLLHRCAKATALLYAVTPRHTFHHKLLELAALGRPIITCPAESGEALTLCKEYDINYTPAMTVDSVQDALAEAMRTPTVDPRLLVNEMSWRMAARRLQRIFEDVVDNGEPGQADQ